MPTSLTHAIRAVELALRLLYFAVAPALLVRLAMAYPIAGTVVNIGFAVSVFAFGSVIKQWVERFPVLEKVLGAQLRFERFYRENPPKPFVYYLFYPLLFPYWLWNRTARRELLLYRGLTVVGFFILVGGSAWDYFRKWSPEIGPAPFVRSWLVVFVIQAIVAVVFAMPLATTVVTLKLQHRTAALGVLFAVAITSTLGAVAFVAKRRHEWVQIPTAERMMLRTQAMSKLARRLDEEALRRALLSIRRGDAELVKISHGTEILGGPIVDARDTLAKLYREDELPCFHLVAFRPKTGKGLVLVLFGTRKGRSELTDKTLTWLGMRENGTLLDDPKLLPDGALREMKRIVER